MDDLWSKADMSNATCTLPGCDKPSRNPKSPALCPMHYHRQYRTGKLTANPWHRRTVCSVEGCDKPESVHSYCAMHGARYQRNGHTEYVGPTYRSGPDHHHWTGDAAGYGAVHDRLASQRGRAADHDCVGCGGRAAHWSYDHSDPDERRSDTGMPYSVDLDRYDPRCVPCHKRLDLDVIRSPRQLVLFG